MSDPLLPILAAFAELQAPETNLQGNRSFSARPFPGRPNDRVAIDAQGAPVILVHSMAMRHNLVPTELTYLSVRHGVTCEIVHADGSTEQATFSTVRFQGGVDSLHDYFLRVVGASVLGLPSEPSDRDVSRMVMRLAELFNALTQEPRQTAQGLWAEVFVIARSTDIHEAVRAWRETPEATYDFSDGYEHAEVKSVVGEIRKHHFSLDQLRPKDGSQVTIVSVMLRQAPDGTSLEELIAEVRNALTLQPDVRMAFERNIAATLGRSAASAMKVRFDAAFARTQIRFIPAVNIPAITLPVPMEVSDIRFSVDLTGIDPGSINDLAPLMVALGGRPFPDTLNR